jgi:hypothetical protein
MEHPLGSRVGLDPFNALFNVLGKVDDGSVNQFLLVRGNISDGVNLFYTIRAKLDARREELAALILVQRAVHKRGFNDTPFALGSFEKRFRHASTRHGHGECGRAGTGLGLNNLVTTKLHTADKLLERVSLEVEAGLREEWNNGDARMAANDCDILLGRVGTLDLGDEAGGADDVEGGDAKNALGIVDALALEDFGGDGHGRVDLNVISCSVK